jgi:hypothetical protein
MPLTLSLRHTLVPAVATVTALGLLTACSDDPAVVGTGPAPTVTVTVDPSATTDPSLTADPGTGAPVAADDQVRAFLDALEAMVAYRQAWTGGDLGRDPEFQQLLRTFVQAKRAIDRTDLWLGANSALTADGLAVSAGEAVGLAQDVVRADATAVDVELDDDDGALRWQIEFSNGDDAEIDATTGAILEVDLDD